MTTEFEHRFEFHHNGVSLTLASSASLFSPRRPDAGTVAMLKSVELSGAERILDLGCGYGLVGVYCAAIVGQQNVVMTDIDERAVQAATANAKANGFGQLTAIVSDGFRDHAESNFDVIFSNPPYHEDFAVAKHFILKGFNRLRLNGRMIFVVKRDHWYRKKLTTIFGGCQTIDQDGYRILIAEKRSASYARRNK